MIYVNPLQGSDQNSGDFNAPLKTLTQALLYAEPNTLIQLQPGQYDEAMGEVFPLIVPEGVTVIGDEASQGRDIHVNGGGIFVSHVFGQQRATFLLRDTCGIKGITITNPLPKGTGIWVESASPAIASCQFINCRRAGIFVVGAAHPLIHDNRFQDNAASGVFFARQAKGIIQGNRLQNTGYGIAISDQAAPLVIDNEVIENRTGIVLSQQARPVLRRNHLTHNQEDGLSVLHRAKPDIGDGQEPGLNVFADNGQADIRNLTGTPLISAGNQANPTRVVGEVSWVASMVPPPRPHASEDHPNPIQPLSLPPPPPLPQPPSSRSPFPDITDHWAEPFIHALVERGIIRGFPDGTFRPDASLTRAQYAVLLTKAFSLPPKTINRGFSDVEPDLWAAPAIAHVERMGLLEGFSDGTFRPHSPLTRLQVVLSLVNGLGLQGGHISQLSLYRDRAEIPSYAVDGVAIATHKQLVVNAPDANRLEPQQPANRAETAAMIYQALVATGQAPAIGSPFIARTTPQAASFADTQYHWAAPFIHNLASHGYIGGFPDGTFHPNEPMTRVEAAILLSQTLNPLPKQTVPSFSDVPDTFWAAPAIYQVVRGGLLTAFGDGTFQPYEPISRFHLILALVNSVDLPTTDLALLDLYHDRDRIPQSAKGAIARATAYGIVVSDENPNRLDLYREATRGEVAAMVYQTLVCCHRAEAIASAHIAHPTMAKHWGTSEIDQNDGLAPVSASIMDEQQGVYLAGQTYESRQTDDPTPKPPGIILLPVPIWEIIDSSASLTPTQPTLDMQTSTSVIGLLANQLRDQGLLPTLVPTYPPLIPDTLATVAQTSTPALVFSLVIVTGEQVPHLHLLSRYSPNTDHLSHPLAEQLHRSIIERTHFYDGGITPNTRICEPFVALPAVQVTLAINPKQGDPLQGMAYRVHVAWAIARGILAYIRQYYVA